MEIFEVANAMGLSPTDGALLWFLFRLNQSLMDLRRSLNGIDKRVAVLESHSPAK
ncbi:hypothetical protein [Ferrimonas balearica]|uniref:hypothetical protein n=1 Tax=Ferrimonas balearica TaxID=44012 RepID=UPI001C99F15A|nr:hypothetical protein [Ferrimonas balearica]MBY5920424.1 hypothetical protein [Ferrimonas balearica]MBY5996891.1 hypothetical protein [Ferrimonas balearica]